MYRQLEMTTLPEGWWVLLGVSLLLWIIFKVKSVYSYFEKRGIPYVKPVFPLGSDVRGALGKDFIGSTAFGLEPECFKKTDSKLRAMGKKFFDMTLWMAIYVFIRIAAPRLVIAMKIKGVDDAVNEYFLSLFQQVFDQCRKNEVTRNDFVQLALQLSDKGHIEVDTSELKDELSTTYDSEKAIETFEITDKVLAAQAFLFYLGGFETLSTTLHFTIYLLAVHGEVQERAREEVKRVKQKYGTFSYEALKELTYLEKCINESVRLFPAVPFLFRECTKDYTFPDGTTIEKGVRCILPVFSMHRDPRYFPDPEEFRPERFDEPMPRGAFLPFGEGPRMCIGKRFALVELKMALAKLLHRYRIEESPLMKKPIQFAPNMILSPLNPLLVKISKCQE